MRIRKKLFVVICFLTVSGVLRAQVTGGNGKDTTMTLTVINPCTALTEKELISELTDKTLIDFCQQVFKDQKYEAGDNRLAALQLLKSVRNNNNEEICFIPFLNMIDGDAQKKSDALCGLHPYAKPAYYDGYCQLKKAQFVVLFYVEFVLVRKIKVDPGMLISELELQKKNKSVTDYGKIVDLYIDGLEKDKSDQLNNPLKGSGFKWKFKTVPHRLPLS